MFLLAWFLLGYIACMIEKRCNPLEGNIEGVEGEAFRFFFVLFLCGPLGLIVVLVISALALAEKIDIRKWIL